MEGSVKVFTVYSLAQSEQWDAVVRSFKEYDVYWLSGYVKAFQIHGDGEPLLLSYDDGCTRGINVTMKRDVAQDGRFRDKIPQGQYFDFATPYGYGGWIIEGEDPEGLFAAYEAWLHETGIICEFVRFHPMIQNHAQCGRFYDIVPLGEVVHMDLSSPEVIWNNLSSKNRNMIRKALKNGVAIHSGRSPELFETFRAMYNATMDKDGAEAYYYFEEPFYASIREDLPQNAQVFWAEKDGRAIAASILLMANGRMNYHLSGSLRAFNPLAPSNLLLYEAAVWGCENGYKTLYLGGGVGSGEDSLFKFKRSFYRNELHRFHIGRKVFSEENYERLLKMRTEIKNPNFFPKYRG